MFSPTDVTDDDEYLATTDPRTGEIKLEFYEYEVIGRQPRGHRRNYEFTGPAKVHERSKKALGHQVGLGEERASTHKESLHDICGHDKSKLATFLFRYRPIDFLRANGTAPPAPPSNTSSSQKRPVPVEDIIAISDSDDPQDEDLQALQEVEAQLLAVRQQLRNKRRKITKVKSESNVKMEPGLVKREKTDVQLDGEVIDLT
ncbi:hypothetical protein VKT23_002656 [Stygiomarasmius scandens]|uniref:DUF7918 domain-containing protein n=1 Tax=Marasmiellus scandens TaxID=2682957 RepID=A0ABR1K2W4_9AGAR